LEATNEEKESDSIIKDFQEELKGNCVYCNHCLPYPVGINIGRVIQMVDKAVCDMSSNPQADYKALREKRNFYYPGRVRISRSQFRGLRAKASECIECGVCMERCPFDVDVIAKIKQAVELFEAGD
jgi:hypothetical protein